jgi:tellurite resistance protein TerC
MYFLLADFADRFVLLKYGLAVILLFIGAKMLMIDWIHIPIGISLGVVALILIVSMVLSLRHSGRQRPRALKRPRGS